MGMGYMKHSLVGIVIVNWNGTADTLECLDTVSRLEYTPYRVYVVDNGSSSSCAPDVRSRYPNVEVLELSDNRGFAGGCNVGIGRALADGAQYVWLLNNDTVVESSTLSELVEVLESDSACGIAGSKVLRFDERAIIDHAGGIVFPWWGSARHRGAGEEDRGQYDRVEPVDYVTGCSLLVRRAVVDSVGLLPEVYFLYFEETEWCVRAGRLGWRVLYAPRSRVYHKVGHSVGRGTPLVTYYFARNSLLFIKRNFPTALPLSLLWWPRYFLLNNLFKRRTKNLASALRGLRDFLCTHRDAWRPHTV